MKEYRGSELKLDARGTFSLPDLSAALPDFSAALPDGGTIRSRLVKLETIYYDTADLEMLGRGVTLELRRGDADNGWQLQIAGLSTSNTGTSSRTEFRLDPSGSVRVPVELSTLTTGYRGGKALKKVATLRTERHIIELLDGAGQLLVEVADNAFTSAATGGALTQWRELELAPADSISGSAAAEKVMRKVAKILRRAGVEKASVANKFSRTFNHQGATGGQLGQLKKPKKFTATAALITAYIAEQDDALIHGDLGLRRHQDGMVHATRVGTRRLRSTLRVFEKFFDQERATALDGELRWYASILGEVRDCEVQRERMRAAVEKLPPELVLGPVAATIDSHLLSEQLRAEKNLAKVMSGLRYFNLLQEVQRWRTDPPFTERVDKKPKVLRKALVSAIAKVDKQLAAGLGPAGDDEQLHKARRSIKRARYAAELAKPVLGPKKAKHVVRKYKDLQQHLVEHQDSVVAAELLRRLGAAAGSRDGENGFTYGILCAQEIASADASRRALR